MAQAAKQIDRAKKTIRWHDDMGIRPVPLLGKRPFLKDFGLPHRRTWEPRDFIAKKGYHLNVGWVMGPPSGGLCDIDMDTDDAALIQKAMDIYSEISPFVFGKDYRTPSHIMFKIEGRPEDHTHARIEAQLPTEERHAFDWRLGGYNGDTDTDGTPLTHQIQTFTDGVHPGTKQHLCWHTDPEDMPTVPWEKAVELFTRLCQETGAEIAIGDIDCSAEPGLARAVRKAPRKKTHAEIEAEYADIFADLPRSGCSGQEIITVEDQAAGRWPEILPEFQPVEIY